MKQSAKVAAVALAFGVVGAAQAQYKCVGPGGVSYQQAPCPATAKAQALDLRVIPAPVAPSGPAGAPPRPVKSMDERMVDTMARDRRIREAEQDIEALRNSIATSQSRMEYELDALQRQMTYTRNNLAGATLQNSYATQMSAISQKYRAAMDADTARLAARQQDLRELRASAP